MQANTPSSYRSANGALLILAACGIAVPLLLVRIAPRLPRGLLTCASKALFGVPCPMCGLSHGFDAALHGRLAEACALNPLSVVVLVVLLAEVTVRAILLVAPLPDRRLARLARVDFTVHAILGAAYVAYAGWFWIVGHGV